MPSRILGSLALLIAAVSTERFIYYGYRSFLAVTLNGALNLAPAKVASLYVQLTILSLVASLIAGGLAFVVAPRIVAVIGATCTTFGLTVFALSSSEAGVLAGVFLASFGSGLVRPCTYAYAARVLTYEGDTELAPPSGRRFLSMGCFVTLLLCAVNLASFAAPMVFGAFMQRVGYRGPTLACAVLSVFAAALFGASILVDRENPAPSNTPAAQTAYRTEPGAPGAGPPGTNAPALLMVLALAIPGGLIYLVETASDRAQIVDDYRQYGFLHGAQLVASVLMSFVLFVVLLVLAQKRSAISLAIFIGAGYAVFAAGASFSLLSPFVARLLAMGTMGLAEPLYGLAIALPALVVRGKAATLVIAGFVFLELCGNLVGGPIVSLEQVTTVATIGGAVLLLAAGITLAALSRKVRGVFEAATTP